MKKILFFFLLGLVTRQEAVAQDSTWVPKTINKWSDDLDTLVIRDTTWGIIVHTSEGGTGSAINELRKGPQAHYLIGLDGTIFTIAPDTLSVNHAGYSVWQGIDSVWLYSVGIEVAGYHNKMITFAQKRSLAWLVACLQKKYGVLDIYVLPHSMVAYQPADKYGKDRRGRKRCGMLFASPEFRKEIGLDPYPSNFVDEDVLSGRLAHPDQYLEKLLFGRNFSTQEILAYQTAKEAKHVSDSLALARVNTVQPIEFCTVDCIAVNETFALAEPHRRSTISAYELSEQKSFFSLPPFVLPRRLKVQK
mgnify:CR=1 FL=1